ncbi:MAG: glycosyltransferase [Planctomycetota bacterium]|jgi:glycosyltransferase involved in cell wall biosynthesis
MKIRVLHVIDHLACGGAQFVVKNILEKMSNERIENSVCTLRTDSHTIPIKDRSINLAYGKYNFCTIPAIAKLCKEYEIDIIHAHLQKAIISSLIASYFCDSRVIIHEHGAIFRGGAGFIYRLLLKALGGRAAMAVANSEAVKEALIKTGKFKEKAIRVVNNFIEFERFNDELYDREKARDRLGIGETTTVVGFVGRLDYCKGADLLLDAAAQLLKEEKELLSRECTRTRRS